MNTASPESILPDEAQVVGAGDPSSATKTQDTSESQASSTAGRSVMPSGVSSTATGNAGGGGTDAGGSAAGKGSANSGGSAAAAGDAAGSGGASTGHGTAASSGTQSAGNGGATSTAASAPVGGAGRAAGAPQPQQTGSGGAPQGGTSVKTEDAGVAQAQDAGSVSTAKLDQCNADLAKCIIDSPLNYDGCLRKSSDDGCPLPDAGTSDSTVLDENGNPISQVCQAELAKCIMRMPTPTNALECTEAARKCK